VERRQVFDLPPAAVEVTEHQLVERECGCGHRTKGIAPAGVNAPVQYGPRIAAIIIYLVYAGQFLSKKRTAQALAELFGVPLSSGTVAALTARAAGRLDGFLEEIRARIAGAGVAGFDETGLRVEGKLRWVHCARTGKYTLLSCHPRRGTQAMDAMGVLPASPGSPFTTPRRRMTPTRPPAISCAALTRQGNCRPSPTRPPPGSGAGPPGPRKRSP
jgi:hypothetical protein